jgi:hypothetical protein
MSQITIYMPDSEARAIKSAARKEKRSVSDWAREKMLRDISQNWPEGYFSIAGSLTDATMKRPPQPSAMMDVKRKAI